MVLPASIRLFLRAVACLLSISAASATTLTSVTSPPSEEGVGYASALRTLVMEQGVLKLDMCQLPPQTPKQCSCW